MQLAPIPFDEAQRLEALHNLNLLDSGREERFDRITRVMHSLFDVPIVLISLIDEKRIWFKSSFGLNTSEEPRDVSICGHTICNTVEDDDAARFLEIMDTMQDERFRDNPLVSQKDGFRYYLGFTLQSIDQFNVGTLCIVDTRPRTFTEKQKKLFYDLGMIVEKELNKYVANEQSSALPLATNIPRVPVQKLQSIALQLEHIKKQFNSSSKKNNVNYQEWSILNGIINSRLASPNALSKELKISAPMMTRKLDVLETKRLVGRSSSSTGDRRFVQIECTKLGEKVWRKGSLELEKLASMHLDSIVNLD